jgi:hypothetical protein
VVKSNNLATGSVGGPRYLLGVEAVGELKNSRRLPLGITANGRALHPVGRLTTVGNFSHRERPGIRTAASSPSLGAAWR